MHQQRALTIGLAALSLTAIGLALRGTSSTPAVSNAQAAAQATPVGTGGDATRFLSFNGSATVKVKPDTAQISVSANGQGASTNEALNESSRKAASILAALDALGIGKDAISSQGVNDWQDYDGAKAWHASNTILVTVPAARAGEIMGKLTDAGADDLAGPSFGVDDQRAAYRAALRQAIADARDKADATAAAMGVKVSGVRSVTETGASPGPMLEYAKAAGDTSAGSAGVVPLQAGEVDVAASVTVVFDYAAA